MKLADTIDQDMRIAEYTLGLSPAREIAGIQEVLSRSDPAAACALKWEAYLLGICDSMAPVAPPADLFARIQDALGHEAPEAIPVPAAPLPSRTSETPAAGAAPEKPAAPTIPTAPAVPTAPATPAPSAVPAAPMTPTAPTIPTAPATELKSAPMSWPEAARTAAPRRPVDRQRRDNRGLAWWRLLSILLGLIVVVLAIFLVKAWSRPDIPAIQIVQVAPTHAAILHAPGHSSTPGWLLTVDPQGTVRLDPQVKTTLQPSEAVQLWTRQTDGQDSRSLGLIDPNQPVTIPTDLIGPVRVGQIFEMTLEPVNGSSTGKPEGPILFIGQVVRFGTQSSSKPLA
jgi:anti-sigma-K factor RskA